MAIDREATGIDLNSACDDVNGDLPSLEYEYRTAGAAANRAETATANTTNKHQQLTRRLAKIKSKETPEIADAVTRIVIPLSEMPAAMAEKIRERGSATIQRLLSSYARHKRGMPSVTSKAAPRAVPPATEKSVSTPSANPLSSAQIRDTRSSIGMHSQKCRGIPKDPERWGEWFDHFRQRDSRGAIDLVLLQETRISIGEAAGLNKLYTTPHGASWTSSDAHGGPSSTQRVGGAVLLLNLYSSIAEMEPWHEIHWTPH